jgi:hypothetical protein
LKNLKKINDLVDLRGRRDSNIESGRDYTSKYNSTIPDAATSDK